MEAKIKISTGVMGVVTMEAEGESYFVGEETKALFDFLSRKAGTKNTEEVIPQDIVKPVVPSHVDGVKEETVVVYDDAGIPSIMRKFSRVTNAELFGGTDKPHPAFVIGGEVYDEIYISVYPNCEINGKPYSLPFQKLWTNITNDDAAKACFSKGEGWHLMTAAEWGLIANISLKNGTLHHGNTYCGKYHADESEKGVAYDNYRTLAGSGPATWTHNHKPDGVHDLCGNVWEMVRGLRIKDGMLQAAKNNDAAMDIDLSETSGDWLPIVDDECNAIYASVSGGDITLTTDEDISQDYDGCEWGDVNMDCESEQLKELALYSGENNAYLYIDSTDGEYFPDRGGGWSDGTDAGVFYAHLSGSRAYSNTAVGFRSAYYKKH